MHYEYLRDPASIYRRSFALVRQASDLSTVPATLEGLAVRLIHACAMPDIIDDLGWHADPVAATRGALARGAPILVDCEMLAHGIIRQRLPADSKIICTLNQPTIAAEAARAATTRSAAAVDHWLPVLDGAIVAIGNAPTALFRLLELLHEGAAKPAAIVAMPVGFVGASESKQALIDSQFDIPFVTIRGRRGGSALAAAAVNALAQQ